MRFRDRLCCIQATYLALLVQRHSIAFSAQLQCRLTHCDYASCWCLSRMLAISSLFVCLLLHFFYLFFSLMFLKRLSFLSSCLPHKVAVDCSKHCLVFRNSIERLKVCFFLTSSHKTHCSVPYHY